MLAGVRYVSCTAMVAHADVRSKAVIMLLSSHCFCCCYCVWVVCVWYLFCSVALDALSSLALALVRKRELDALL